LSLYTGTLTAIHADRWFASLLSTEVDGGNFHHLRALLAMEDELDGMGVSLADRQALRGRLVRFGQATKYADVPGLVFRREHIKALRDKLLFGKSRQRPIAFRSLDLSPLGIYPAHADPAALIENVRARLKETNDPRLDLLAPVDGASCLVNGPLVTAFAH